MALTLGYISFNILAVLLTLLIGCYTYLKWHFKYWERKGIPYVESRFPFGSFDNPLSKSSKSIGEKCQDFYANFKAKGCKHVGIHLFVSPAYVAIDSELIKNIMQKDFDHFTDRGVYCNEKDDPLSGHLFALGGAKWRNIRIKLTPTFTSGKLKMMFPILVECGNQLKEAMDTIRDENEPIDIKDFAARFTTNVIGSCAFGIECNCFKDVDSEFRKKGKRVFTPRGLEIIKYFIGATMPDLARRLKLKLMADEITDFFMKIITDTVSYRENNNIVRKDFLQLLIDIKNSNKDEIGNGTGFTLNELAAQAFVFFIAGYETSSTTIAFCLLELAMNPDIQQKVREEIEEVLGKHNGEATYDALVEMKYMGQVIDETLRKYPPVPFLTRKSVQSYKVPDSDLVLEKGTVVVISALGLQRDPEYFPDPEKFDPDRFSEENRSKIVPFTYLPFGDGPRVCIGLRFGVLQTKIGLTVFLRNYKFSLNNKTKMPLKIEKSSFVMAVDGDIWLNVEKLKK